MTHVYESSFYVSSFHAVNETGKPYAADANGFISLKAGDVVRFESYLGTSFVSLNTLVFKCGDTAMKIQLNDNEKYPMLIPAKEQKGVQYMRVYSFTALGAGKISFDGLAS